MAAQEDVELSSSHDNSVEDMIEVTKHKDKDEIYIKRWVTRWHRSADTTKKIIRTVFSLKPNASLGHEWNDASSQVSPEYVAVPARMTDKLAPKDLELGEFTGDSAQQFKHIYRASRLSSKCKIQPNAGSPHYQHTKLLRNNHTSSASTSFLNPTCCVDGQPTSPYFDELAGHKPAPPAAGTGLGSDVSVLTSPTVTAGSVEVNPIHSTSRPSSVTNEIFTIYEDNSDLSVDSLDARPRVGLVSDDASIHSNEIVRLRGLDEQLFARDGQYYVNKFQSTTSPVLQNRVYSGYIKKQNFSPTKFSV